MRSHNRQIQTEYWSLPLEETIRLEGCSASLGSLIAALFSSMSLRASLLGFLRARLLDRVAGISPSVAGVASPDICGSMSLNITLNV
jgi:hypothetical protein